jgi:hypothetical protein
MRCLLKAMMPVETANASARDGKLAKTIQSIVAELKPEAAYFVTEGGKRTALIFFDLQDSSQIPAVAEPWFLAYNAEVEIIPVMNADDLAKAEPHIEQAVKKYR